jgi:hypothetical protein
MFCKSKSKIISTKVISKPVRVLPSKAVSLSRTTSRTQSITNEIENCNAVSTQEGLPQDFNDSAAGNSTSKRFQKVNETETSIQCTKGTFLIMQ